ncbi:MAG: helix-turn-helix domain-containing protein [bacterium]
MSIEKQLQNLGLSEKEAKVYLSALELGSSSVREIARKANVNRATTYVQIESLIKRGLMSSIIQGKKRYFTAENPGYLLKLLDAQKWELNDKRREFEKYAPELKALFNCAQEKPKVKYYEGLEGIKAIQHDLINTESKKINEVTNLDIAYKAFPTHPKDHRKKLREKFKDIPFCVIYSSSNGEVLLNNKREKFFVSPDKVKFSSDIIIYGENKVAFINAIKLNGVIIENKEIHDSLFSLFELAKNGLKKNKNGS